MAAEGVQHPTSLVMDKEINADLIEPTMLDSRSPSPELFDILEATTIKMEHNMAAFTNSIQGKKSHMFLDDRYMSSEEALSLSPAGEDLNLTDEDFDDYDVDDMLEDIQEDEEAVQWTRSRSNSKVSVVDCAVALKITSVGKPKVVEVQSPQSSAGPSVGTSVISRQASTIHSYGDDGNVFVTADSTPETRFELEKPSIPMRIRPTLPSNWTSQASSFTSVAPVIPPRKDSITNATTTINEDSPVASEVVASTPIKPIVRSSTTPITPITPATPTKGSSFLKSVGSRFSGMSRKEKQVGLSISGPTDFQKLSVTPEMLAAAAKLAPPSPSVSAAISPRTPTGRSTPITISHLISPVTMLAEAGEASSSTLMAHFSRSASIASTPVRSLSAASSINRPKMLARGAAEREPTLIIPDFPDSPKEDSLISLTSILAKSEVSTTSVSTTMPSRKPLPAALTRLDGERPSKRRTLMGFGSLTPNKRHLAAV